MAHIALQRSSSLSLRSSRRGTAVAAQEPAARDPRRLRPTVGQMAPDFTLPGATRYGLLKTAGQAQRASRPNRRARFLSQGADQRLNGSNGGVP